MWRRSVPDPTVVAGRAHCAGRPSARPYRPRKTVRPHWSSPLGGGAPAENLLTPDVISSCRSTITAWAGAELRSVLPTKYPNQEDAHDQGQDEEHHGFGGRVAGEVADRQVVVDLQAGDRCRRARAALGQDVDDVEGPEQVDDPEQDRH